MDCRLARKRGKNSKVSVKRGTIFSFLGSSCCAVATKTIEVYSVVAAVSTWRKRRSGRVLMKNMNRSKVDEDEDRVKPERKSAELGVHGAETRVHGDANLDRDVIVVRVCCPSEKDDGAVHIFWLRNGIENLNESELFGDICWEEREMMSENEREDDFDHRANKPEAGRPRPSDENVRTL